MSNLAFFSKLKDFQEELKAKLPNETAIQALVTKGRKDGLKNWTVIEFEGNRDADGYTARDRLYDMKALHAAAPKRFPLGKIFYKHLAATFRQVALDLPTATAGPGIRTIGEPWLKAMKSFTDTGSRVPMCNQMAVVDDVSEMEAVGVMKFALAVKVSSGQEQCKIAKMCLKFFVQHKFQDRFEERMKRVKSWIDDTLCAMFTAAKANKINEKEFIRTNLNVCCLILPRAQTLALLEVADKDYSKTESALWEDGRGLR
jgi:hypothetical protein